MWLSEVVEPVIGLTPERWDLVLESLKVAVFSLGVLVAVKL
ncbi:MAG: hypothetical protein K0S37_3666 [Microbacterium sp.]|jgi:hypothetical protein|nr:hypothetical protein [Microbacterium sp.]